MYREIAPVLILLIGRDTAEMAITAHKEEPTGPLITTRMNNDSPIIHSKNHEHAISKPNGQCDDDWQTSPTPDLVASKWWNVNIPPSQHTLTVPAFLAHVSVKDQGIMGTPDSRYTRISWPEARRIVRENRLEQFQRAPSELRRYLEFVWKLRQKYGSVMAFIMGKRLGWRTEELFVSQNMKFDAEETDEIKILRNDWPYGLDERITHLVVWTKFGIEEDPATGDLTERAREQIDAFVRKKFAVGTRVDEERIIWFKNWASLKSVKAVEHFHVMLFDPDMELVREVTNGDVPFCERMGEESP